MDIEKDCALQDMLREHRENIEAYVEGMVTPEQCFQCNNLKKKGDDYECYSSYNILVHEHMLWGIKLEIPMHKPYDINDNGNCWLFQPRNIFKKILNWY